MDKKIYFNNIDNVGELFLEEVLFEANYPVLFTLRDKWENIYIAVCMDTRTVQRWIVTKTNEQVIIDMLTDKITIRDMFDSPGSSDYYLVNYPGGGEPVTSCKVNLGVIDPLDLPTPDMYFEDEENDFKEYIEKLEILKDNIVRNKEYKLPEVKIFTSSQMMIKSIYNNSDLWIPAMKRNYLIYEHVIEVLFKMINTKIQVSNDSNKWDEDSEVNLRGTWENKIYERSICISR